MGGEGILIEETEGLKDLSRKEHGLLLVAIPLVWVLIVHEEDSVKSAMTLFTY